jgi:hypothetical protein
VQAWHAHLWMATGMARPAAVLACNSSSAPARATSSTSGNAARSYEPASGAAACTCWISGAAGPQRQLRRLGNDSKSPETTRIAFKSYALETTVGARSLC